MTDRTKASGQTGRVARQKAAQAKVEAMVDTKIAEAAGRSRKAKALGLTAEQIIEERDTKRLSWKQVAINLDLGSPGAARRAYSELTGKAHNESDPVLRRAKPGSGTSRRKLDVPSFDDETDQEAIEKRLNGSIIRVIRNYKGIVQDEEFRVQRVRAFTYGRNGDQPLQVEISDSDGTIRTFRVADIKEVR